MQQVMRFKKNRSGRDFVVGDLHGHFDWLSKWMIEANFEPGVDRLFGTGDLIDRGPNSTDCLRWLDIMTACVKGNHEDMFEMFHRDEFPASAILRNGGAWYVPMISAERQPYADAFESMPYAIEIETDVGLIGVTHAECNAKTWNEFMADPLKCKDKKYGMPSCLWGRDRIVSKDSTPVEGVFLVIVGHTIVKEPGMLGNHHYIDTGAGRGLEPTVVQIQGT